MMTVAAIVAGLLPILWSTGAGAEVMRRIAVPMVGGMISSALLTLVVIPVIYAMVKSRGLLQADEHRIAPIRRDSPRPAEGD
jgi:Cu(I)/Ag(I) efflux system membrane protein CusA/SilA